jgi:DNA-binding GntR family transcriptional regulator
MAAATAEPIFADFQRPDTLPERIASFIREAIIEGRWGPGGRLVESHLARQFGVSRAPLREALRLLVAEGLVVWSPHRGPMVRETSDCELAELFAVRGNLEAFAAELAARHAAPDQIARMRELLREMDQHRRARDLGRWYATGLEFHNALIAAAHNRVLSQIYDQLKSQFRRYQAAIARLPALPRDSVAEHRAILSAIEQHDPATARRMAEAHIRHLSQRFLAHEPGAGDKTRAEADT